MSQQDEAAFFVRSFGCALFHFMERKGTAMKKALSLLLVLVMLLSLCACGKNDTQNIDPSTTPSQATTDNTEESTDGTTETTQAITEEPTTTPTTESTNAPTEESTTKPTERPTTKPTETPTTPTACSHSYKDATCTAPKTCTKCGATNGSAAGHSYKDATCTAPKTCSTCGVTEGKANGHSWTDATCIAPTTCNTCGATEGNPTEHKYDSGKCSICGKEDIVNPIEYFKNENYMRIEKQEDYLTTIELEWSGDRYEYIQFWYCNDVNDPNIGSHEIFIDYEGERYYVGGGGGTWVNHKLTDTYVEFFDPGNNPCAKYILQHDGSLRLHSSATNHPYFPQLFVVGTLGGFDHII